MQSMITAERVGQPLPLEAVVPDIAPEVTNYIGSSALQELPDDLRYSYVSRTEYAALKRQWSDDYAGTLPAPEDVYAPKGHPLGGAIGKKFEMAMYAGARILVVDDNDNWREVIEDTLTSQGHEVVSASNKDEALRILQSAPAGSIDGAVIDGLDGDGPEVHRAAKAYGVARPYMYTNDPRYTRNIPQEEQIDKSGGFNAESFRGIFYTAGQTSGYGIAGNYSYDAGRAAENNFYGFTEAEYLDLVANGEDPADWPSNNR